MSSVTRCLRIIDLLSRQDSAGVRAIAHELDLPVASVHRLLTDLAADKVIERNSRNEWELSYRLLDIAGRHLHRIELPRLTRPYCERIAHLRGENVHTTILAGLSMVYLDTVRGSETVVMTARIGQQVPLHCTAAGKVVMGFMSDECRTLTLDSIDMTARTPNTITDRSRLEAELDQIRERGFACDNEEILIGVHCVAAPLFNVSNRPIGAISVAGPNPKDTPGFRAEILPMLIDAAAEISRRAGYNPDTASATVAAE